MNSNTSRVKMAPTGSMTIPSQRNTWLMWRSVAPRASAERSPSARHRYRADQRRQLRRKSSNHQLARLMTRKVTSMPTVTRLRTTPPRPRISSKRSVSAPRTGMIATDSDTSGNSRSPNSRSGCTKMHRQPSTTPNSSNGKNGRQTQQPGQPLRQQRRQADGNQHKRGG